MCLNRGMRCLSVEVPVTDCMNARKLAVVGSFGVMFESVLAMLSVRTFVE